MQSYIIRRVVLIIPTLILVSIIVFMGLRFIPGDVVDLMMSRAATGYAEAFGGVTREAMLKYLGLDLPIHEQYLQWIGGILQGDFGKSLWTGLSVNENLFMAYPSHWNWVLWLFSSPWSLPSRWGSLPVLYRNQNRIIFFAVLLSSWSAFLISGWPP